MDFANKVVLITGAGRGIGRAIALAFGRSGARVVVNDINPDSADQTAEDIVAAGGTASCQVADVANKMAVQTMIYNILEAWDRIDLLVNNAGVEPTASILELDEFDWNRTLDVNLKGAFFCLQTAARAMKEQGGGVVVNISSIAGRAHGLYHRAAYVASKTGLLGLTREAARELAAHNIRVNAVCPGVIVTPMTERLRNDEEQMARWRQEIPLGELGQPADVTELVLFLCSDAARYITGQAINVDGGKVMS